MLCTRVVHLHFLDGNAVQTCSGLSEVNLQDEAVCRGCVCAEVDEGVDVVAGVLEKAPLGRF